MTTLALELNAEKISHPNDNYNHAEFLEKVQENMNYINEFKNSYAGGIALTGGFSLEAARKAGLLKG